MIKSIVDELVPVDCHVVPLSKAMRYMGIDAKLGKQLVAYGAFPVEIVPNWNGSTMQFVRAASLRQFLLNKTEFATSEPAPIAEWATQIRDAFGRGVYFVQSILGGPVKIGKASDVVRRLLDIQAMNPFELVVIGIVPVSAFSERRLNDAEYEAHTDLREYRLRLEWFRPHADVLAYSATHGIKVGHTVSEFAAEVRRAPEVRRGRRKAA
jgi:hypothetical protein